MKNFEYEDVELLKSFAALASAALENSKLYKNINGLLEGFVRASVDAIESRDQATSGHSERVALLTCGLAENISRSNDYSVRHINFTKGQIKELRYASLLHDFGKIGIKEDLLLKANKLFPIDEMKIKNRLSEFAHIGEIKILKGMIEKLIKEQSKISEFEYRKELKKVENLRSEIEDCWDEIKSLNKSTVLDKDNGRALEFLCSKRYDLLNGEKANILTPKEIEFLSIKRGSLTDRERFGINMHVSHTYKFLKQIPWTREFKNLAAIAHSHHEKLDGTGYPLGLTSEKIPAQSKIMTIADIFDALVAMDRPYKKAIPISKALDILNEEAKMGKIDKKFLEIFLESKLYNLPTFTALIAGNKTDKKAA